MKAFLGALLAVFALLSGSMARAETIVLKDGSRMSGSIVGASKDEIRFDTSHGVLVIKREEIEKIDYDSNSRTVGSPDRPASEITPPPSPKTPISDPTSATPHQSIAASVIQSGPDNDPAPPPKRTSAQLLLISGGYRLASDETEGGPQGSISLLAPVSEALFLGGSVGFARFNNKVNTLSKGDVTIVPASAQMAVRSPGGLGFTASLGYAFVSHSLDSEVETLLAYYGYSLDEHLKGSFTAEAALGFTTRMSPGSSFGIEVGYQYLKPTGQATLTDLTTGLTAATDFDVALSAPFIRAHLGF